jgi:aquaporin Z
MAGASFLKDWIDPWRSYVAEFLGTFFLVLISSWVLLLGSLYGKGSVLETAVVIGFVYTALVYATLHAAGGFLNPAVTISLWLVKKLSGPKAFFFIVAQILASLLAAEVLFLLFGQNAIQFHFGEPSFGLAVSAQTAFIVEAILTAGLVFTVFGTMVDRGGPVSFGPLVVGFYLVAATIVAQPVSGAVFNPARVLGPAILSRESANLIIYVVSGLVGGLFGLVYDSIFLQKSKKK